MNISLLKDDVLRLDVCEAKYYLLHLLAVFEQDKTLSKEDPLVQQTKNVITALHQLFESAHKPDFKSEYLPQLLANLKNKSLKLYEISKVGKYSHQVKQAALRLCGFMFGLILFFPFGLITMGYCLLALDKHNKDTLKQLPRYFLTGGLCAGVVSVRFMESFENKVIRQLRFSLEGLNASFRSLNDELQQDVMKQLRAEILTEYFGSDEVAKKNFELNEQKYRLIGFKAQFLSINLKGYVGQHGTLVFHAGTSDKIIELGSPSEEEIKIPEQEYRRTCLGSKLIDMCVLHRLIYNQYACKRENLSRLLSYTPGVYDCQSHVDMLLASINENLSLVKRGIADDAWFGRFVTGALQRYGIFDNKPTIHDVEEEQDIVNIKSSIPTYRG